MSAPTSIRRLTADDAASFKALRLEALAIDPVSLGSTFDTENALEIAWFAKRLEDTCTIGAWHDGELVGAVGFVVQQGPKMAHKGRLFGMYVRPAARSAGLGRLLLTALLDVARTQVELVQLTVVCGNGPARSLYDSVGFVQFGREPKALKYDDCYYDLAHMTLDFGHPENAV